MKRRLFLTLAWVAAASALWAQSAADVVVPITISTSTNPPSITLTFPTLPTDTLTIVGRKLIDDTQWQAIRLANNATTFTDVNVSAGTGYEYIVIKRGTALPPQRVGLVYAGIQVLPTIYRGKLILVVDDALSNPLSVELDRLVQDLRGDGWQVIRRDINTATSTVASVKALLRSEYVKDPERVVAALLLGNIPVPYSGNIAPDGHPDHQGAWPTDYYYGDMDENAWTDNTVNTTSAARPANHNVPGDGKFDQSQTPTLPEIVVGRVDFSNLTTGWNVPQVELYRRYLNKNHAFRTGAYKPAHKTLVDDNFGFFGGEAFAQNGYRNGYAITGPTSVQGLDFFNDTKNNSFLIGYGCGAGTYTSANGVGSSANFQTDSVNIVFSMLFGSYFGDWDFENNPLMPSALASKGGILTCSWAGRPNWHLHHMALGEPIMTSTYWVWLNSFLQFPVYPPNFGADLIHVGLLGDPTLRAHAVRPPQNATAAAACGTIQVDWEASADSVLGYLVYWAEHPDSAFALISSLVNGTSFVDSFPVLGQNYYMVRAVRLEEVPSGSYFNQSTGVFTSALYNGVEEVSLDIVYGDVSCAGNADGSATAVASGGVSFAFAWSNGANTSSVDNLAPGTYTVSVTNEFGCSAEATVSIQEPAPLEVQLSADNPSCAGSNDGSISASVSGGTPDYTFEWSNGTTAPQLTAATAGTYTLSLTDANGCIAVEEITLTEPEPIEVELLANDPSCAGADDGSIFALVSGGTPSYTFEWSNGRTEPELPAAAAGTYTLSVTDAVGCTAVKEVTLTEPEPIALELAAFDFICGSGSLGRITTTVTGGTPPYSYRWSDGSESPDRDDLPAGTYTVSVEDANGCLVEAEATVNEEIAIEIVGEVSDAGCAGAPTGSIRLQVSGGTVPYTFNWSNGATDPDLTGIPAGTYTVVVSDAEGCSRSETFVVGQATTLQVTATSSPVRCFGNADGSASAQVDGGTPDYSFLWSNGATGQTADGLAAGTYTVVVTDAAGCTQTATAVVAQPDAITASAEWRALPCLQDIGNVSLTVSGGTPSYSFLWSNGATTPDLQNVPPDAYQVEITDANGCTAQVSATVVQPAPPLRSSLTFTQTSCPGILPVLGTLEATVSGGTPSYTFQWSNGTNTPTQTNVPFGTYTLTVIDAAGCTHVNSQILPSFIPDWVIRVVGDTPVSCHGGSDGSVLVNVDGATPPYTFKWSNGSTTRDLLNISAGSYVLTATDAAGCTALLVVVVEEPTPIDVVPVVQNVSCPGRSDGSVNLNVKGGTPPYMYLLQGAPIIPPIPNLPPAVYTFIVVDANGCSKTVTAVVSEPVPIVAAIEGSLTACWDSAEWLYVLDTTAAKGPFFWTVSPNGTLISGQGTHRILVDWISGGQGTIRVTYTWGANACPGESSLSVTVIQCTSNASDKHLPGVQVMPNPFQHYVRVRFDRPIEAGTLVRMANAEGRLVLEQPLADAETLLHLNHLPAGMYMLQVLQGEAVRTWRLVKTE